jgi:predicted small secreted protein
VLQFDGAQTAAASPRRLQVGGRMCSHRPLKEIAMIRTPVDTRRSSPLRTFATLLLIATFSLGLSACNTMSGLGKDTQKAGEKVEKEAERHID